MKESARDLSTRYLGLNRGSFVSGQSRSPFCSTVAVKLHRTLSRLRRLVDIMTGSVQHRARSSRVGCFMTPVYSRHLLVIQDGAMDTFDQV